MSRAFVEQVIDGSGGHEVGIGANYAVNGNTKLYVRHDFINSLNGPFTLSSDVSRYTSVAGVTTVLPDNTQVFNEYRVGDGIGMAALQKPHATLRKTLQLRIPARRDRQQRVKPLSGVSTSDPTASHLRRRLHRGGRLEGLLARCRATSARSGCAAGAATGVAVNKLDEEGLVSPAALQHAAKHRCYRWCNCELIQLQSGMAFPPRGQR